MITYAGITRKLNVVETCGLDHFVVIVTVQVTYVSDQTFYPHKLKYSTISGHLLKITYAGITRKLNVVETCGLDHFVVIVTVQVTYVSDQTFYPHKLKCSTTSGHLLKITYAAITRELNVVETCGLDHFVANGNFIKNSDKLDLFPKGV